MGLVSAHKDCWGRVEASILPVACIPRLQPYMSLQIHDVSADVVRDVGRSVPHLPVALAFWHRTSNHRSAEKDERVLCGQLRLGQSLCKFLLETANHFKWPLVLSHHVRALTFIYSC